MNSHGFFCSLGVAALALALLLPTAANAQTPAAPVISISDDDSDVQVGLASGLNVEGTTPILFWQVDYVDAGGNAATAAAVVGDMTVSLGSDREGPWKAMYRGCKAALIDVTGQDDLVLPDDDVEISDTRCGASSSMRTAWSAEVLYTHGPPPAPMGLEALPAVSGDAITLTWARSSDKGIAGHDYRYRMSGADEFEAWKDGASPQRVARLTAGTMYMFEVRAVGTTTRRSTGMTDDNKEDRTGPAAMITATAGGSAVPTLTESAALLLGLMLMGGGMYYTRRRQSGGLTHA